MRLAVCLRSTFCRAGLVAAGLAACASSFSLAQSAGDKAETLWDGEAAADEEWSALDRVVNLGRRGQAGLSNRYRVRRVNRILGRTGETLDRSVQEGEFEQTLVREVRPGVWALRLSWKRFAMGQGDSLQPFEKSGEVAYAFDPDDPQSAANPSGEFERLGAVLPAFLFKALAVDVVTWHTLRNRLHEKTNGKAGIGIRTSLEMEESPVEITLPGSEEVAVSAQLGPSRIVLAGLTRRRGEPCALVRFAFGPNRISQELLSPGFALLMTGSEFFRGSALVSLKDGRIVAGELWGPVIARTKMGFQGREPAERPSAAILQHVTLEEISPPQKSP